jgi:hypothetical protein
LKLGGIGAWQTFLQRILGIVEEQTTATFGSLRPSGFTPAFGRRGFDARAEARAYHEKQRQGQKATTQATARAGGLVVEKGLRVVAKKFLRDPSLRSGWRQELTTANANATATANATTTANATATATATATANANATTTAMAKASGLIFWR